MGVMQKIRHSRVATAIFLIAGVIFLGAGIVAIANNMLLLTILSFIAGLLAIGGARWVDAEPPDDDLDDGLGPEPRDHW